MKVMAHKKLKNLDVLVSLCKQRGFVFPSSEIYGGLASCWDYGPLGSQLKLNVKLAWWKAMTYRRDILGLDASILMHPGVWKASGHVDGFSDPMVDCKDCKNRFREDMLSSKGKCPTCGSANMTEAREFNLMFKTHMGPLEDEGSLVYLRPETAQGIFVNFENVQKSSRKKIPFGIAQIGKSFRNEITPGNFIFRTREFEQMEMQYFVAPGDSEKWYEYWKEQRRGFYKSLGFEDASLRFKDHGPKELAHYARAAVDIEFEFPFGWQEVEGIHNRGTFDLSQHQSASTKKLEYFDEALGKKYLPEVVETAAGCDRLVLALLCQSYREEEERVVLGLPSDLAPVQVGVLPLSKKAPLKELAEKICADLEVKFRVEYDESGSIGRRYRRQDEIGTPFCVTIDFESLEDQKVTVRHRDSMEQKRVDISGLKEFIKA